MVICIMSYLRARALSGSLALVAAFPLMPFPVNAQQHVAAQSFPYTVDDLIGHMTLEEKVSQMRDHAPAIPSTRGVLQIQQPGDHSMLDSLDP